MDSCCQLAALLGSKPVIADQLLDVPTVMVRGSQYDYKPMWEMVRDGTGTPSRLPSFGNLIEAGYRIVTKHNKTYYIDLSWSFWVASLAGLHCFVFSFFVIGSSKTAIGRPPTPTVGDRIMPSDWVESRSHTYLTLIPLTVDISWHCQDVSSVRCPLLKHHCHICGCSPAVPHHPTDDCGSHWPLGCTMSWEWVKADHMPDLGDTHFAGFDVHRGIKIDKMR